MDPAQLLSLARELPFETYGEDGKTVITCVGTIAFADGLTKMKSPPNTNKEPRYSCAFIIPDGADLRVLQEAAARAWREDTQLGKSGAKPARSPFKQQARMVSKKNGKRYDGFGETGFFLNAETKNPPTVLNNDKQRVPAEECFSGCHVRIKLRAQGYENGDNTGVKFWLQSVQMIAPGRKLKGDDAEGGFSKYAPRGGAPAVAPNAQRAPADAFGADSEFGF